MDGVWGEIVPVVLRVLLMTVISFGVLGLTVLSLRWPHRHHRVLTRRRMPRFTAVAGAMVALTGALIALVGTTDAAEPGEATAMMLVGSFLALLGMILLWCYVVIYVEATPEAFIRRGILGRERRVAYADLTAISVTPAPRGPPMVRMTGRDGTRIVASVAMVDLKPYRLWQSQQGFEHGVAPQR